MIASFAIDAGRTKRSLYVRFKLELPIGWFVLARMVFGT